jgi:hypothetical protein
MTMVAGGTGNRVKRQEALTYSIHSMHILVHSLPQMLQYYRRGIDLNSRDEGPNNLPT